MAVNAQATTANYDDTRLNKPGATSFTVQVTNQPILYQLNVPPFGNGDNWLPAEGAYLLPGFWNFDPDDWKQYGVATAAGIRCKAFDVASPGVVSIS